MTKEEAIKIINCYDIGFYDLSGEKIPADKLAEAFDMAIEALQRTSNAYPTHECIKPTHSCVEMINREDAIIAVRKHRIDIDSPHKIVKKTYEDVIRDLPFELVGISDQLDEDMISRCELFNRLAVIPAPPEANEYKAEVYKVINGM